LVGFRDLVVYKASMKKISFFCLMIFGQAFSATIPGLEEILREPRLAEAQSFPIKCSFGSDPSLLHQTEIKYDERRLLSAKVCLKEDIDLHFLISLFSLPEDSQSLSRTKELLPTRVLKVYNNQEFSISVICSLELAKPFCEVQMKELEFNGLIHEPRFQRVSIDFSLPQKNNFINLQHDLDQELTGDKLWIKIQKIDQSSFAKIYLTIQE
jgi:hypothetical protein